MQELILLGHNIAYSLSPQIHMHWFQQRHMPYRYRIQNLDPTCSDSVLRAYMVQGIGGNVTIPFKERAYHLLDRVDTQADKIGAINVFKSTSEGVRGWNSDYLAIQALLRNTHCEKTVVFGCGGAARAAVSAVLTLSPRAHVTVISRKPAGAWFATQVETVRWPDRMRALNSTTLVINATPLGLNNEGNPVSEATALSSNMTILDMVYRPIMTPLLCMAQAQGAQIITGMDMLLHQAREGFNIWFGETPEIDDTLKQSLCLA